MKTSMLWAVTIAAMTVSPVWADAADDLPRYDPSKYSQKVTGCDLLAGHPNDPYKNVVGLEKRDMDLPAAIAACKVAVERDPTNPRLNYQLARVFGYSGSGVQALPYREVALATGYPQAVMVYSFLHQNGQNHAVVDKCLAGKLGLRSARDGRAAVRFVWFALEGEYKNCPDVTVDHREMLGFLDAADKVTGDGYTHAINSYLRNKIKAGMK